MQGSTFEGEPAEGRMWLDLSEAEYERMRKVLGLDWEWEDELVMRFAPPKRGKARQR